MEEVKEKLVNKDLKKCSKCGVVKNRSEFYAHNQHKNGLTSHCKQCLKDKQQERSKIIYEYNKKYIKENSDKRKEWAKRYWIKRSEILKTLKLQNELREKQNRDPNEPQKKCTKCGEKKPLSEFHVDARKADGRVFRCKKCTAEDRLIRIKQTKPHVETPKIEFPENIFKLCPRCHGIIRPKHFGSISCAECNTRYTVIEDHTRGHGIRLKVAV